MRYQKIKLEIFIIFLCLLYFILPIQALHSSPTFKLGDSSVPVDEDDFIEYDFESSVASNFSKVQMNVIDIYQLINITTFLVLDISVSILNLDTNDYEALIVDSIEFANQTCLIYNKTTQYFRYNQFMENLLINGLGGFYIMPNDPVNINIIKGYIDTYTSWSANVIENTITIDINNDQAILQYNDQGILIREEIRSAGQLVSTLSIHTNNVPNISFGGSFALIFTITIIGLLIIRKKRVYTKYMY